jgi:hypothetical protein
MNGAAFGSRHEASPSRADRRTGTSSQAQSRAPLPAIAATQPIGQGVPSANAPTAAEPMMPDPYWIAPTSADTTTARSRPAAIAERPHLFVRLRRATKFLTKT